MDIEELKNLVTKQIREAAAAQVRQDALIAELQRARIAHPGAPADGDVDAVAAAAEAAAAAAEAARVAARTEKFNKLAIALRKSFKVKEYKEN